MTQSKYLLLEQSDFLSNYVGSFQSLRADEELLDVILACEDETIEAHKVVLSACSPFFRNVFKKAKQNNPFVYLKGVFHKDLVALLDYIYTGQAQVLAEDVDRFIQVGKDMQVKGLVEEEEEEEEVLDRTKTKKENSKTKKAKNMKIDRGTEGSLNESCDATDLVADSDTSLPDESSIAEHLEPSEVNTQEMVKKEMVQIEDKNMDQLLSEISQKIERTKDEEGMTMWKCTECGKLMKSKGKLEMHVEIHLEGFSHYCPQCGRSHKTRNSLQAHVSMVHRANK